MRACFLLWILFSFKCWKTNRERCSTSVLSRKTTSCVFNSLQRRSSGRVRRLSANMELGSELEAHNPLESFHQLRSQPHATPAVRNISSQGIVDTQVCFLETLHAAGTDVSSAGTFFSSTAAASLLGCLSERGAFRRHDEFWSCGHGLHAWAALQELRRDESPCCA